MSSEENRYPLKPDPPRETSPRGTEMRTQDENLYPLDVESVAELARLMQQDRWLSAFLGHFPALLEFKQGDEVLDVACGPGGWALDVAQKHPAINVSGIDISIAMIRYAAAQAASRLLYNVSFGVADATMPLDFAEKAFVVVSARLVNGFLTRETWPLFVKNLVRVTSEYVILTEQYGIGTSNSAAHMRFSELIEQAVALDPAGRYFSAIDGIDAFLREAGCEIVLDEPFTMDFSYGSPFCGVMRENLWVSSQLLNAFFLRFELASFEELTALTKQIQVDMQEASFQASARVRRVTGWVQS